jgi:tetratricopeptide (TPR) repeat protein
MAETKEAMLVRMSLAVRRLDEIEALARAAVPFDGHAVLRELSAREEASKRDGRTAEAEFLTFLRPAIEDAVRRHGFLPSPDPGAQIDSVASWIDHAISLSSLLDMYALARKHRHALPADAFTQARALLLNEGWGPPSDQHVVALTALGFAAGTRGDRVIARLLWATERAKTGRAGHARRHIVRARRDLWQVESDRHRRLAHFYLAAASQGAGDLEAAIDGYRAALNPRAARQDLPTRFPLAFCLDGTGRSAEALAVLEDIRFGVGEPGPVLGIMIRAALLRAHLYEDDEEYDLAAADYSAAAVMAKSAGDRNREFRARNGVAGTLEQAGRYREAVRSASETLTRVRSWDDPRVVAAAHNNLGRVLLAKGDTAAAREQYAAAMECRVGDDRPGLSESLTYFGLGDTRKDDPEFSGMMYLAGYGHARYEAGELRALAFYLPRLSRPDGSFPAGHLDDLRAAISHAAESGEWKYHDALASVLANHLAATGQRAEAISLRRRLLARADATAPGRSLAIDSRARLADLLAGTGDCGSFQEAFGLLWQARSTLDGRLRAAQVQQRRSEILAGHARVYELLIRLLVHSTTELALPDERGREELAFDLHEEAKSRSFLAGLSRQPILVDGAIPPDLLQREEELLVAESRLQRSQWVHGASAGQERMARLAEVRAELSSIWDAIRPLSPEYVRLRNAEPVTLGLARDLLRRHAPADGMALVSYFVGSQETTCFVLRSDDERLRVCRIELTGAELASAASRLRGAFNGDPAAYPPVPPPRGRQPHRRSIAFLDDLGPKLLSFTAYTDGLPLACAAPHGPLHLLPLHAMPRPDPGGGRLLEAMATTYCPSLSSLAHVMARPRPASALKRTAFVAGVAAREDADPGRFEDDHLLLDEAGWSLRAASGVRATREAVLAGLPQASVAHLTCHGHFSPADPLASGLLLAHDGTRPTKNLKGLSISERVAQMLQVRDLADLQAPIAMLILRACSAASVGQENSADEFSGLARSFLHAGASAIIAPMWNVDQDSSGTLLARFYQQWRDHPETPAWRLLWAAQRWMCSRSEEPWTSHPYHWAPFILTGDWRLPSTLSTNLTTGPSSLQSNTSRRT